MVMIEILQITAGVVTANAIMLIARITWIAIRNNPKVKNLLKELNEA